MFNFYLYLIKSFEFGSDEQYLEGKDLAEIRRIMRILNNNQTQLHQLQLN